MSINQKKIDGLSLQEIFNDYMLFSKSLKEHLLTISKAPSKITFAKHASA